MKTVNLGQESTILNHFISEIRDVKIQQDSMRFRRNIERIGEIFSYEISKEMDYKSRKVVTPLGVSNELLMLEPPILATVLRAGLPFHQGFLNYFDHSDSAFISAYREYLTEVDFEIRIEYMSTPDINKKNIILCDPMIASGHSMKMAIEAILSRGTPQHIHIAGIIASSAGIKYIREQNPIKNCTLWIGAEDAKMNSSSYIIPGLGDAGDLCFGEKK